MSVILSTADLTKKYAGIPAVNNASLELQSGRIYGLLGPNGSGKSTLMKMAAGLVHPTSGSVKVLGRNVTPDIREHVVYMPTEPYFYDYMTVRRAGQFHEDFYKGFSFETYGKLVQSMGLKLDMKLSQLSSGMAAKLKLAAAVSRDAELIMLDEPLNGIDLVARDVILSSIIEKANENNTVLISSHLVDVVENILDDVIFIKDGHIVLTGNVEEVRQLHGKSIVDLYREVFK
ncbi:MAG: putative ABC transporter ATP-binding protein YxlF [Firmicutes bacterium ADurb.Bin182]|nr:MAG: putative ABC transporter ATP-binding protein YxlF [Firmicutes bacterium ADurb.Bin182]